MTDTPYLSPEPPPWPVRLTAGLLLASFAAGLGFVVGVPLPETVTAPYVLVAIHPPDPVRAPATGSVDGVHVEAGETVRLGQELLRIRSDLAVQRQADARSLSHEIADLGAQTAELQALQAAERRAAEARASEQAHLTTLATDEQRLAEHEAEIAQENATRLARLADAGAASEEDLRDAQQQARRAHIAARRATSNVAARKAAKDAAEHEHALVLRRHEAAAQTRARALEAAEQRLDGLDPLLDDVDQGTRVVTAPCDGTLLTLAVHDEGTVVATGEELATVACVGQALHAELSLSQDGAALLEEGHRVQLLHDAFPYQRYGTQSGTLVWVGPAATDASRFTATVSLDAQQIDIARDREVSLRAGMTGTARVLTGHFTLFDKALEPLRRVRELAHPPVLLAATEQP